MKIRGNVIGTTMKPEKIAERIGGGGGANALIVTIEGDKASHTSDDIHDHIENGGLVYLHADFPLYVSLTDVDYSRAVFTYHDGTRYEIDQDGNVTIHESEIGNISTALDQIIEIQEELIGV